MPVAWLDKICRQETNHGIAGLVWFNRDGQRDTISAPARTVIRDFIEQECEDDTGTFRTLRQRYPLWLLAQYLGGTPVQELVRLLKSDVTRCRNTGEIGPTLDDVSRATAFIHDDVSREGGPA